MSSEFKGIAAAGLPKGLPEDAVPFSAVNGTVLALTAAPQQVKAGVTGKRHFITSAMGINITAGEAAATILQDEDDVESAIIIPVDATAQVVAAAGTSIPGTNAGTYFYDPPLVIAVGKAIEIHVLGGADEGDVFVSINGYTGT